MVGGRRAPFKGFRRFLNLAFVVSLALFIVSGVKRKVLPLPAAISTALQRDPVQKTSNVAPFAFNYRGGEYLVKPVADYELWGMVVTHNNIHSIGDMYHNEDSVDIKDLCVIWGHNVKSDNFNNFEFWSDPWTCWYRTDSRDALDEFEPTQLSNNHLLSDNEAVLDRIRKANIGDQIHLRGMLVNYSDANNPGWSRDSSTVRTDTGNGACEVVFVEDFDVLRPGNPGWNQVRRMTRTSLLALAGLIPFFWLLAIYKEQRR